MPKRFRKDSSSRKKGKFDSSDTTNVRHSKIGVWDLYEEVPPKRALFPGSSGLESFSELLDALPYIRRMLLDILSIHSCWPLFAMYLAIWMITSLLPAVTLWYSAQLLNIVQYAVDERKVDAGLLLEITIGHLACSCAARLMSYANTRVTVPLNLRIKQYYSVHIFHAMARLDVPTFADDAVQRQLEQALPTNARSSVAWETILTTSRILSAILRLTCQVSVLINALRDQRDGPLLAGLCVSHGFFRWATLGRRHAQTGVWAATTKNATYIRMEGMKRTVNDSEHRQEIVAGSLQGYLLSQYQKCVRKLGDQVGDFPQMLRTKEPFPLTSFIADALQGLPQVAFALRAIQYPASIPVSLASLHLITQTTTSFTHQIFNILDGTESIATNAIRVKRLYEITNIPNRVMDGTETFPVDQQSLAMGVSVEFRNVSFQYPGSDSYALRNASFKVLQGQLCVIVGANGSGKSTILKLIARLYDPSEGDILINGRDIKLLKLDDLRRSISVLFQDYTLFPLSIKDNIGLGDPENATDESKIWQAAQLGGAADFIERLPDGFDTYLERPVRDHYSGLAEGTASFFGRPVDYSRIRSMGDIDSSNDKSLSGGQIQRVALSRTFMRSLISQPSVGLLLFDEPSASLDVTAEHDLFERLRQLRGSKTMIFSSHRFGNLTRHADLILYMHDSVVVEEGTHELLLKSDGKYAHLWKLQSQAFQP